ncbi:MAG TPA: uroporphyrinogen-III C-methyltransferase [Terriglobia bacterium]|nr:uroporphyrinogen-III C-methyltransferase [Terriglobia bacterium]
MSGKVYLVGAGPGDPGLFTLKGKRALEQADVVIYDFLANRELLRFTRPRCESLCVGKRPGEPTSSQEEINQLLISKAARGMTVVRLKGGDPFIFGRGGEEAQALARAGIPFEVVPGISSGYAAPAYAGIPVTHREIASSVAFLTGHEDPSKPSTSVDWSKLATGPRTLVLFMAVRNLPEITAALIQQGREPSTPVAVIRWGTRAAQEVVTGTLADISGKAQHVEPPAVTVIGEVVQMREELNWFEHLPLFGKRIVTTRTRQQAGTLRELLEELGAETIEIPAIEIHDPESWEPFDAALHRLESFDYLLLTSANGVRSFLQRLTALKRDVRDLKGLKIGAIGPATAAEFAKVGIRVDFVPHEYRAEGLLESLQGVDIREKSFLIPRAKVARDLLPATLTERGAHVEVVECYETVQPAFSPGELARLLTPRPDVITFTSSSTVTNFLRLVQDKDLHPLLDGATLASIGPITSRTIREHGLQVSIEAEHSTIPGLIEAIQKHFALSKK